jgi:hypothetical protein
VILSPPTPAPILAAAAAGFGKADPEGHFFFSLRAGGELDRPRFEVESLQHGRNGSGLAERLRGAGFRAHEGKKRAGRGRLLKCFSG